VLKRILLVLIAFPAAVALITLAIANRQPVQLVLDPFRPEAPLWSVTLPLFAYLIGAMIAGVILGGVAAWLSQGRYRRDARRQSAQAKRWHEEADRLTRERDRAVTPSTQAALPAQRDAA
jgi:uncharacterized integral membrane protein